MRSAFMTLLLFNLYETEVLFVQRGIMHIPFQVVTSMAEGITLCFFLHDMRVILIAICTFQQLRHGIP